MRQVHALEHEMNGREGLHLDPAGAPFGSDFRQRDAGLGVHQGAQQILMWLKHWATVPADALWRHRAGLAQPPH